MNRTRLILVLAACLVSAGSIYAASNPQTTSLFSRLPTFAQNGQAKMGSLAYNLFYEEPASPLLSPHQNRLAAVKGQDEAVAVMNGVVLSENNSLPATVESKIERQQTGEIDETKITQLISNILGDYLAPGFFKGEKGEKGDTGAAGAMATLQPVQNTAPASAPAPIPSVFIPGGYVAPNPSSNFNGTTLFAAADLSSQRFTTDKATVTDTLSVDGNTTLQGDLNVSGTITGNVAGTINPGLTAGSVLFQGASGLAQDNANLFWDDTNNRLGIGTVSPATKLDVVGSIRLDGGTTGGAIYLNTAQDSYIWSEAANSIRLATASATSGSTGWIFTRNGSSSNKIYLGDTGTNSWIQSGHNLYLKANRGSSPDSTATPDMVISSGNVGIGTASPSSLLSVGASNQFQVASTGYLTSSITSASATVGEFRQNTANGDAYLDIYAGNNGDAGIRLQNPNSGTPAYWLLSGRGSASNHFRMGNESQVNVLTAKAGANGGVGIQVEPSSIAAQFHVNAVTSGTVGQIIRGASGQTADLFQIQNSTPTSLVVVNASGNVGIGTASPQAGMKLDVNGAAQIQGALTVVGAVTTYGNLLPAVDDAYSIGTTSARWTSLRVGTGTSSFAGNVGIGTTIPGGKLDVVQSSLGYGIRLLNSSVGGTKGWSMVPSTNETNSDLRWYEDATSGSDYRLTFQAGGNVGIGTTSPASLLHLRKDQSARAAVRLDNNNSAGSAVSSFELRNGGLTGDESLSINLYGTGYSDSVYLQDSSYIESGSNLSGGLKVFSGGGDMSFGLGSPSAANTKLIIDYPSGNVGIGTSSPNHPIDTGTGAHLTSGGTWTNSSSRALKENFTALDPFEALDKIDSLSIEQWNYKSEDASITHIGPVAEEFHAAFNTGGVGGDKAISTIDPAGVALLGVQGLSAKVKNLLDFSWVIEEFKKFGVEIKQDIIKIKSLSVEKLEIGSSEKPSGFVLYDEDTKEAYCVKIKSGEFVKIKGNCKNASKPSISQPAESSSNQETDNPKHLEESITESVQVE